MARSIRFTRARAFGAALPLLLPIALWCCGGSNGPGAPSTPDASTDGATDASQSDAHVAPDALPAADAGADHATIDAAPETGNVEAGQGEAGPGEAGTCVDLSTDPKNCGTCGHDCHGATCTAGTCDGTLITVDGDLDTEPLFADGSYVYFDDMHIGGNYRVASAGGAAESLLYGRGLTLAGGSLFTYQNYTGANNSNAFALNRASLATPAQSTNFFNSSTTNGNMSVTAMAVGTARAYVANWCNLVRSVSLSDPNPQAALVMNLGCNAEELDAIAVDDSETFVYVNNRYRDLVYKIGLADGKVSSIPLVRSGLFLKSGSSIYEVTTAGKANCAGSYCDYALEVFEIPLATGTPRLAARYTSRQNDSPPTVWAIQAGVGYVRLGYHRIEAVPLDGSAGYVVYAGGRTDGLAVDDHYVYVGYGGDFARYPR